MSSSKDCCCSLPVKITPCTGVVDAHDVVFFEHVRPVVSCELLGASLNQQNLTQQIGRKVRSVAGGCVFEPQCTFCCKTHSISAYSDALHVLLPKVSLLLCHLPRLLRHHNHHQSCILCTNRGLLPCIDTVTALEITDCEIFEIIDSFWRGFSMCIEHTLCIKFSEHITPVQTVLAFSLDILCVAHASRTLLTHTLPGLPRTSAASKLYRASSDVRSGSSTLPIALTPSSTVVCFVQLLHLEAVK